MTELLMRMARTVITCGNGIVHATIIIATTLMVNQTKLNTVNLSIFILLFHRSTLHNAAISEKLPQLCITSYSVV
jgi:hypothetical protein